MDRQVMRFVEAAANAASVADLNDAFLAALGNYGIEMFAAAVLDPVKLQPEHFLASNYPSAWVTHYTDRSYERVDPVVRRSMLSEKPFLWSEPLAAAPAKQLFDEAATVGIVSGFAVPVRLRSGQHSVVSVTSALPQGDFFRLIAAHRREVLTTIYVYHDTLCALAGVDKPRPDPIPPLEAEVLRWLAAGRSRAETAAILCLPECAVAAHVENAMARLDITSADHVVAEAVRRGLVQAV